MRRHFRLVSLLNLCLKIKTFFSVCKHRGIKVLLLHLNLKRGFIEAYLLTFQPNCLSNGTGPACVCAKCRSNISVKVWTHNQFWNTRPRCVTAPVVSLLALIFNLKPACQEWFLGGVFCNKSYSPLPTFHSLARAFELILSTRCLEFTLTKREMFFKWSTSL